MDWCEEANVRQSFFCSHSVSMSGTGSGAWGVASGHSLVPGLLVPQGLPPRAWPSLASIVCRAWGGPPSVTAAPSLAIVHFIS